MKKIIVIMLTALAVFTATAQTSVSTIADTIAVMDTLITNNVVHIIGSELSGNIRVMCQQGDIQTESVIDGYFRMTAVDPPLKASKSKQGEEIIKNGNFDSVTAGVAKHWVKGPLTDSVECDQSGQYAMARNYPCAQAEIWQIVGIQNDQPKTYKLEFDMVCYGEIWILMGWNSSAMYNVATITSTNTTDSHYSITFTQRSTMIDRVKIVGRDSDLNWFRINHISMVEVPTPYTPINVGVYDKTFAADLPAGPIVYYNSIGQLLKRPPSSGFYLSQQGKTVKKWLK